MSLVSLIKQVALGAVEQAKPVSVLFGTVSKVSPLEVVVDQRFSLSADFLIVPERLSTGIETGDKVILLRVQGGQDFIVMDKVVSQ